MIYGTKIPASTPVMIRREVRGNFSGTPSVWGPMSIAKAAQAGHLSSSSGTVDACMSVAEGPHKGAPVFRSSKDGHWYAQEFDPDYRISAYI